MFRHSGLGFFMVIGTLLGIVAAMIPYQAFAQRPSQQCSPPQIFEPYIVSQKDQYQLLIPYTNSEDWEIQSIHHHGIVAPEIPIEKKELQQALTIRFFTDVSGEMYRRDYQENVSRVLSCFFVQFLAKDTIQILQEPKDIIRFGFESDPTNVCSNAVTTPEVLVDCFHQQVNRGKLDYATLQNLEKVPGYATEVQILIRLRKNVPNEHERIEIAKHKRMIVLDFSLTQDKEQYMWMPLMPEPDLQYSSVPCDGYAHILESRMRFRDIRNKVDVFRSERVVRAKVTQLITPAMIGGIATNPSNPSSFQKIQPQYDVIFVDSKNPSKKCPVTVTARLPDAYKPTNDVPLRSQIFRTLNSTILPIALIGSGMLILWNIGLVKRAMRDQAYKWLWEKWPS